MAKVVDYRAPGAKSPSLVPAVLVQRRTVLVVAVIVFIVAFLLFSGGAWAITLYVLLTDGALAVLWLFAAAGIGSLVPMPRFGSDEEIREGEAPAEPRSAGQRDTGNQATDRGSPDFGELSRTGGSPSWDSIGTLRLVTGVAMGLGVLSLLTLGLGLAGLLNGATAWGLIAIGIVALGVRAARGFNREAFESRLTDWLRADVRHTWLWLPAVVTLALACAAAMALPGALWGNVFGDPHGYDVVEYHLQVPREWYEAGRIIPLLHNAFSFFPFNVEMHYLLAMHLHGGPWAGMYLAQLMHVGFVAIAVAAVAAAARALGASAAGSAIAGLAAASTPWLLLLAPVAYNEGGLLLFGVLSVAWALVGLKHRPDDSARSPLLGAFALAGAFAGFASGAKLTGVPIVLLAVGGVSLLALVSRRGAIGRAVTAAAVFGLAGLLTFSPWLVRNTVWTGNPVFPEAAGLLGKAHFTDVQVERWSRAHSAKPDQKSIAARVAAATREIGLDWRYGGLVLPLCIVAAAFCARRWRSTNAVLLSLLGIHLLFWLAFTHLQSRFFVLAVPVAALLAASPKWRWWPAVAFVLLLGVSAMIWMRAQEVNLESTLVDVSRPGSLAVIAASGDETLAERIASARSVTLIGDAKAFWFPTPPGGLHYRTVFDVAGGDDVNVLEAWRSGLPVPTSSEDVVIINAAELDRFAKTYWPWSEAKQIPPVPFDERDAPNVVRR